MAISWSVLIILSWSTWYIPAPFFNNLNEIVRRLWSNIPSAYELTAANEFTCRFFSLIADSFLLRFGWMQYSAGAIFNVVFNILLLAASLGILIYFGWSLYIKFKRKCNGVFQPSLFKLIFFFFISFCLQLLLIWLAWAPQQVLAQGRYLFPVLIPIAALFATGLFSLFSVFHPKAGKAVLSVLVIAEFLFLNYVVWNYIIPVFHLTQKIPLPGL